MGISAAMGSSDRFDLSIDFQDVHSVIRTALWIELFNGIASNGPQNTKSDIYLYFIICSLSIPYQ